MQMHSTVEAQPVLAGMVNAGVVFHAAAVYVTNQVLCVKIKVDDMKAELGGSTFLHPLFICIHEENKSAFASVWTVTWKLDRNQHLGGCCWSCSRTVQSPGREVSPLMREEGRTRSPAEFQYPVRSRSSARWDKQRPGQEPCVVAGT